MISLLLVSIQETRIWFKINFEPEKAISGIIHLSTGDDCGPLIQYDASFEILARMFYPCYNAGEVLPPILVLLL
jgi:hypothetical protein